MQNEYGLNQKTRKLMKSPQSVSLKLIDQIKQTKRKYDQITQVLQNEHTQNEKLQQRYKQMLQIYKKREKQLIKKQQIHTILLQQFHHLQSLVKEKNYKQSQNIKQNSTDQYRHQIQCYQISKNNVYFSTTSQEENREETQNNGRVGYFRTIFHQSYK